MKPFYIGHDVTMSLYYRVVLNIQWILLYFIGLFYNGTDGTLSCYDIDNEFVECADPTGCGTGSASLSWDYQVMNDVIINLIYGCY